MLVRARAVEPDSRVEVLEALADRDGRRGEDHGVHLGQPALREVGAHVEFLGAELLHVGALARAAHLRGVHIGRIGLDADQLHAGKKVREEPRGFAEVGSQAGVRLAQGRGRLLELLDRLGEHVGGAGAGRRDLAPRLAAAGGLVDPQCARVVAGIPSASRARQAVDRLKEVGAGNRRPRGRRRGLGKKPTHQRRVLEVRGGCEQGAQHARLCSAEQLEGDARLLTGDLDGPLAAGLGLEGVGLVDHPVADRGKDVAVGIDIAQEQRVVGHHDIAAGGAATGAVQQAQVGVVRAARAQALAGGRGKHGARHVAPADAQRVEVAIGRLAGIRVAHRDRREHVRAHGVVGAAVLLSSGDGKVLARGAVHAVQAGIVVVALQAVELEPAGQRFGQRRQLM